MLVILKKWLSVSSTICEYSMEWTGNHLILRTKNLGYGARGKETKVIFIFKREVKQWVPNNCPCRICKNYLPNIGFI